MHLPGWMHRSPCRAPHWGRPPCWPPRRTASRLRSPRGQQSRLPVTPGLYLPPSSRGDLATPEGVQGVPQLATNEEEELKYASGPDQLARTFPLGPFMPLPLLGLTHSHRHMSSPWGRCLPRHITIPALSRQRFRQPHPDRPPCFHLTLRRPHLLVPLLET